MTGQGSLVHPTRDDPVLAGVSAGIGGPAGIHGRGHPWWTPVRVLLVVTAVCWALGMLQKSGCYADDWQDGEERYAQMCYSDLPYLYTGRGFAELAWPYTRDADTQARYDAMEYPVVTSYVAWGTAWLAQLVAGPPDLGERAQRPPDRFFSDPQVVREIRAFVITSALLFAACALLATGLLAGVHRRRPWDALGFAASPALLLSGLVNWDLLAVVLVAGVLWAWARDRPFLTGALIGVGVATKLYPLFLLGGVLVICLRQRRLPDLARVTGAALLAWGVANLPAYLSSPDRWRVFWSFNADRGADLGSVWLMLSQALDRTFAPETINRVSLAFLALWCVGVLLVGLRAPLPPRLAQLGFLVVAGFLLVNKVYSPQYVLWLLPLAVLARPRWRDLLVWQAGEVLYFCGVWWYLGGDLDSASSGGDPVAYWVFIVARMAAQLYLAAVVVRDVLRPERDPVPRAGGSSSPPRRSNPPSPRDETSNRWPRSGSPAA